MTYAGEWAQQRQAAVHMYVSPSHFAETLEDGAWWFPIKLFLFTHRKIAIVYSIPSPSSVSQNRISYGFLYPECMLNVVQWIV